jgi:hypothetical protein
MKKIMAGLFSLAVILIWSTGMGQAQKGGELARLMNAKLDHSKKLLEGIALADFNRITNGADALLEISRKTEWFVFKTPKFELYTNEFRRAAENIVTKSKAKSIDGVTLAYFELTMSCVRCHQYVREVREARLPVPNEFDVLAYHAN